MSGVGNGRSAGRLVLAGVLVVAGEVGVTVELEVLGAEDTGAVESFCACDEGEPGDVRLSMSDVEGSELDESTPASEFEPCCGLGPSGLPQAKANAAVREASSGYERVIGF